MRTQHFRYLSLKPEHGFIPDELAFHLHRALLFLVLIRAARGFHLLRLLQSSSSYRLVCQYGPLTFVEFVRHHCCLDFIEGVFVVITDVIFIFWFLFWLLQCRLPCTVERLSSWDIAWFAELVLGVLLLCAHQSITKLYFFLGPWYKRVVQKIFIVHMDYWGQIVNFLVVLIIELYIIGGKRPRLQHRLLPRNLKLRRRRCFSVGSKGLWSSRWLHYLLIYIHLQLFLLIESRWRVKRWSFKFDTSIIGHYFSLIIIRSKMRLFGISVA